MSIVYQFSDVFIEANLLLYRLGRPGVDVHMESIIPPAAVLHLEFLVNEGKLVGATSDDVLHLWNFRENKKPEIIHSLKFQRER